MTPSSDREKLDGSVAKLRGSIADVTDIRERQREPEQIETVFQNAQDALSLTSADEGFTTERVNPAYENQMGVSAKQARGQTLRESLETEEQKQAEAQCRRCVEQREPVKVERTVKIDGEQTHWQTRIAPAVVDGTIEYIAGSTRNVTESRERRRELRLLQQAIEEANVGITLADPSLEDNPLVYTNNAYKDITGYSEEAVLGRNCRHLQFEATRPMVSEACPRNPPKEISRSCGRRSFL